MKFSKLKYGLKNDKIFLILFIFVCILILTNISLIAFDIAELIISTINSAALANGFLVFNIVVVCLNITFLFAILLSFLIKKNNK